MKKLIFGFTLTIISLFVKNSTVLAASNQYITLDAFSGTPGVTLNVSGGGYTPSTVLSIYTGSITGSPIKTATTSEVGEFMTSIFIPSNTSQGALKLIGIDTGNVQAENSYYVVPFSPTLIVNAPSHTPFSKVNVSGSGFAPNEKVNLNFNNAFTGSLVGSSTMVTTDGSGSFSIGTITIPSTNSTLYHLNATGQSSGAKTFDYFWIDAFYPNVNPSSYYFTPGSQISFNGGGFAANEKINIYETGTTTILSSFTADNFGSFNSAGSFNLPPAYNGLTKNFRLTGETSGQAASTNVVIGDYYPSAAPSSYWLLPGADLSFSGSGFAAGETIEVKLGESGATVSTIVADQNGSFNLKGNTPADANSSGGVAKYYLIGNSSHASASPVNVTIGQFYPQISPSEYYVYGNSFITITGSNFAPNEQVTISVINNNNSTSTNTTTATTSASGMLTSKVFVPFGGTGASILVLGSKSKSAMSVGVALASFFPSLSPSSYYIIQGGQLILSGSGYVPLETITISGAGVSSSTNISATASGTFISSPITIPFGTVSPTVYTAKGNLSGSLTSVTVALGAPEPQVNSDAYFTNPGANIHVNGVRFGSGETVHIVAGSFSADVLASATGTTPTVAIPVAYGSGSTLKVIFTGASSGAVATLNISIGSLVTSVTPNSYYTSPGSPLTFSGIGFAPTENMTVKLNNLAIGNILVGENGTFTYSTTTPFGIASPLHYTFQSAVTNNLSNLDISLSSFSPYFNITNYYALGGSAETFAGGGFAANEQITITFGQDLASAITPVTTVTSNSSGAFSIDGLVPFSPSGNKTFKAVGSLSGAVSTTNFTIAPVYTSLNLGTYAGAPGTAIQFIGSGYFPNELINITTSRNSGTVTTFSADASGNFNNSSYIVPMTFTGGPLTVTTTGQNSFDSKSIIYYVTGQ